jgi:hypothetical protein
MCLFDHKTSLLLERCADGRVGGFDVYAQELRTYGQGEAAIGVYWTREAVFTTFLDVNHAVLDANTIVIFTEGGCLVYDTCAGVAAHVTVCDNFEGTCTPLRGVIKVEKGLVFTSN